MISTGSSIRTRSSGRPTTSSRRSAGRDGTVHGVPERIQRRSSARDQLITAAVEHLSVHGPAGLQPQEICQELGLSKALVNYHFGGREGLIAEAMVVGYERYVEVLMEAADAAGPDQVARLMAWIDRQVEWTTEHRGLAAALDFPDVAFGRQMFSMAPDARRPSCCRRGPQLRQPAAPRARRTQRTCCAIASTGRPMRPSWGSPVR